MTIAVTSSPVYPVADKRIVFTFTPDSGANYVRIWVTGAPDGSELKKRLTESDASRVSVFVGDASGRWEATFDTGGAYSFIAQQYYRQANEFGGGYAADPDGYATETKVDTETEFLVYVGQRLTTRVGFGEDTATLVYWVWNDTIRATTFAEQGEATPAIVDPTTVRARTAGNAADTVAALLALQDVAVTTAIGSNIAIRGVLAGIGTAFEPHAATTTYHDPADNDNDFTIPMSAFPYPRTLPEQVSLILRMLRRHMTNDDDGAGAGTGDYHPNPDYQNLPMFEGVGDIADAYVAMADCWRSYEAHRVNTNAHNNGTPDTVNILAALPLMAQVHLRFLQSLASTSAPASAGDQSGVVYAATWTGAQVD